MAVSDAITSGVCCLMLANPTFIVGQTLAQAPSEARNSLEQQVENIASRLEGVMDTAEQSASNPKVSNVRMVTCRMLLTSDEPVPSGILLYQEQAIAGKLAQPYRQRFLQLAPSPYSQTVRSLAFKPANAAAWVNVCDKPLGDRRLKSNDLGRPVCSVFLKPSGLDYVGNTPVDGCPANIRGAVRITNHIVLHQTGMDTWDRGYDANGKQVWGARSESYQFRKRKLQ